MRDFIDPQRFVITRKRKKYKFAKFSNADNCFEFDKWKKRSVDYVEVGAGTGLFSVELARRYPNKVIVAIDVKADRLQKGAYAALEAGLTNVFFLRARADQIDKLFSRYSIESIWINFADPYPKKRSAGRRLTHSTFIKKYQRILKPDGILYLKHDHRDFFCWSLEQFVYMNWQITELSFNLPQSSLRSDYKILTTYEQRWLNDRCQINFVAVKYIK